MAQQAVFDAQAVTEAVAEGIARIENASSTEELKAIKTQYAGADSAMTQASKAIGALPADQKKDAGKLMGKLRADFGRAFGARETELKAQEEARALAAETVDMTLPIRRKPLGARHPLAKVMEDWEDFFISMGWRISSGPEVETEWFDFDALNFGPDHPARQMQDTFYVKGSQARDAAGFVGSNMVLRTQTSSDQVRALLAGDYEAAEELLYAGGNYKEAFYAASLIPSDDRMAEDGACHLLYEKKKQPDVVECFVRLAEAAGDLSVFRRFVEDEGREYPELAVRCLCYLAMRKDAVPELGRDGLYSSFGRAALLRSFRENYPDPENSQLEQMEQVEPPQEAAGEDEIIDL